MAFGQPLSDDISISMDGPTITGTTAIDSTPVNMAGYSGVLFIVRLGTAAANNNIRVQQDTAVAMGTAADLAGTLVASGANNIVAVEVLYPGGPAGEAFVRCRVTRGTSTTIDSITTILFGARQRPTVMPSTVSFESWTGPIEGTA
jgi:hypothetical protein